jgi:hypothetical protein
MKCRFCLAKLKIKFIDLGYSPPSNNYLSKIQLNEPETHFPLRVFVCEKCWLVQTEDYSSPKDLFQSSYAYLSSTSATWLEHAFKYSNSIIKKLSLNSSSFVVEVASNDGYLLKNFVNKKIPCLGVEPTKLSANIARSQGIPVLSKFFGENLAKEISKKWQKADLICGNNVYAHVPDINDFTKGLKILLSERGVITLEFPHLLNLIKKSQFDTIYHEHYSYLSLTVTKKILGKHGLRVFDVEKLNTHGGSLRIYACHNDDSRDQTDAVSQLIEVEKNFGLQNGETYLGIQEKAFKLKRQFIKFLLTEKAKGSVIAGYGAAAKANTLINYAGIGNDMIDFICDGSAGKQGKYMPGSHIPIVSPSQMKNLRPDWVIIFPWNISNEIMDKASYIKEWGGKFVSFGGSKKFLR